MEVFPALYPITAPGTSGEGHLEQVMLLAAAGVRAVQLRDKTASSREFYSAALDVCEFARTCGMLVIVNDRVDIALAVKADGVHLGQDDLPPSHARKLLGSNAVIGLSTHSEEQASLAALQPVDYIAIGPVFPTSTKPDAEPAVGLDGVRSAKSAVGPRHLVAIGGIDSSNFASVLDAGADSAAVISAIWSHPQGVEKAVREFAIS